MITNSWCLLLDDVEHNWCFNYKERILLVVGVTKYILATTNSTNCAGNIVCMF